MTRITHISLLPLAAALALSATTARGVTVVWGADINNITDPTGSTPPGLCSPGTTAFLVYYGNVMPNGWVSLPTDPLVSTHDPSYTGFFVDAPNTGVFDGNPVGSGLTPYFVNPNGDIVDIHGTVMNTFSAPFYIQYELSASGDPNNPGELEAGSFFYDPLGTGTGKASTIEVEDGEGFWRIIVYDPGSGSYGFYDVYATADDFTVIDGKLTLSLDGIRLPDYIEVGVIPEPSAVTLLALGAAVFGLRRRRKQNP